MSVLVDDPEARPATERAGRMEASGWREWLESSPELPACAGAGRVLLVNYEFPPIGGSGVHRPARLVKYLPRMGWDVEVVTAGHERFPWSDPSLLAGIPSCCRIHRVPGFEPACLARGAASTMQGVLSDARRSWLEDRLYWRMIRWTRAMGRGNGERFWIPAALRAALRIHRCRPVDAVISSGPPHFVHEVGLRFSAATGLPWLADVRDPLVSDFDRSRPDPRTTRRMQSLERVILRRAAMVVTTCPALAADLQARYRRRRPESIRSITNGFDRDALRNALLRGPAERVEDGGCLFVAAGAWYGRRQIEKLVEPLACVLARRPAWAGRVRLVLAGTIDARQRTQWERRKPDWLALAGYLDHAAALRLTASAHCTIVMVPDCRHGRLSIPGKLFELVALPVHVLGLAPASGDVAQMLREAGASTVVPLEAEDRVADALESIVAAHFEGRLPHVRRWSSLDVYDRQGTARRFVECLEAICRRRPS